MSTQKTNPADLDKLLGINSERAAEIAARTLTPTTSCYVALTGFKMSEPDEKTGERHALLSLSQLDLMASVAAGKPVALPGAFEMQSYDIKVPGKLTPRGKGKPATATTQEDMDKAEKSRTNHFGIFCRAAGVEAGAGFGWLVSGLADGSIMPVGIFNPSTNGPELPDSYKDQSGKVISTARKDYSEFNFGQTTPSNVMDAIHSAVRRVTAAGLDVNNDSLAEALALPDLRAYAKLAKQRAQNRPARHTPGGGSSPGGFGGMGEAPPEA